MREILFKARTQFDNTKFVYGSLFKSKNLTRIIENEFPYEMKIIDENTICQFTGLLDKNGSLIFESDILKYEANDCAGEKTTHTFIVVYNAPKFELKVVNSNTWRKDAIVPFFEYNSYEIKGNIYN